MKRVIVITGAGGHICRELVERFAANKDIYVFACDLRIEKLAYAAEFSNVFEFELDVADRGQWRRLVEKVEESLCGAAVSLINGAGINDPSSFMDLDESVALKLYEVNVLGAFIGTQTCVSAKRDGVIGSLNVLNITSTAADPPLSKAFFYSATKAALSNLSKNFARELAEEGIRVNALRPGFFPTEWNKRNFLSEDRVESIMRHTPMRRFGEPVELFGAVKFLLDDESSSFITGSELVVDGGFIAQTI